MASIKVLIVEDSPVARELLIATLNSDRRLEVIYAVETAERALAMIPRLQPDIICMDVRLPGMNGIEATRRIMAQWPTPIIVVAADLRSSTIASSMEALAAGALAVVEKPKVECSDSYRAMATSLCNQFVNLSKLNVVRQRFGDYASLNARKLRTPTQPRQSGAVEVIGIAASTGGPAAVATVLRGLPEKLNVPVLIVQHMGGEFLEGYAAWLDTAIRPGVSLARNLEVAEPGRVYVAPGGFHLGFRNGRLTITADPSSKGFVPSADALFSSLARDSGARSIGALLTGMGRDGADGMLEMHAAGAHTIAQDEATSVVYGMPGAAKELGAVREELPIDAIAARIVELTTKSASIRQAS